MLIALFLEKKFMTTSSSFPTVSVLIPAFNEEKYILNTLQALKKQDYPFFEIIIADNASSDRTSIIIERFIDDNTNLNIRQVYEGRKGTNFARERARLAATGSIIAQLDADCVPPKDWIGKGVSAILKKSSNRVAVTGPYDYFDGDKLMRYASLMTQKIAYPFINYLVQIAGKGAILIGGNAFILADSLERVGGYNTALTFYGDDIDLGKRLAKLGHVTYDRALVQLSSSRRFKAIGFWKVNKRYQNCFWELIVDKQSLALNTTETNHPR